MISRVTAAAAAATIAMAGCGLVQDAQEQARAELISACMDPTGANEQTCSCAADRLEENISLDALRDLIDAAARGDVPPQMEEAVRACS